MCVQDLGYEGIGRLQVPWWRKKAEEYQLSFIVEAILVAARVCQRQESVRRDGSKGVSEGGSTDSEE